jgi:hypothetical protein
MTGIKPSSHGIVVDHVESGVRYAISDKNYDVKVHRKVRDLVPGETVIGFRPKRRDALVPAEDAGGLETPKGSPSAPHDQGVGSSDGTDDPVSGSGHTETEGASPEASQEEKEGN